MGRPDRAHFVLPVAHVEFTGSEVGLRLSGTEIGTEWIRVQLRAEQFNELRHNGRLGERAGLRIAHGGALLFDANGDRVRTTLTQAATSEVRDVVHA